MSEGLHKILDLELVSCDLCGSDSFSQIYSKPDFAVGITVYCFNVVKCDKCGLVYVNPRPTVDEMSKFYDRSYHLNRDSVEHQKRYQHQIELLGDLEGKKILDIGCAKGDFLVFIKRYFPTSELHGIDFYTSCESNEQFTFYHSDLLNEDFSGEQFDLVMAWAVFEHLHEPSKYFQKVHDILNPGGEFVFLVTNADSRYSRYAYREDIPRHTYHYSKSTLHQYANKVGFEYQKIWFTDKIYDGRGFGAFKSWIKRILGINWDSYRNKKVGRLRSYLTTIAHYIDAAIFWVGWEREIERSGIIINRFKKPK